MIYTEAVNKKLIVPMLAALAFCLLYRSGRPAQAQPDVQTPQSPAQALLVRCGVTDKNGKSWEGTLEGESAGAEVIALAGYHFQPPDSTAAGGRFSFATRPWVAAFQQIDLSPARPGPRTVFPNGVYATVKGSASARFRLSIG